MAADSRLAAGAGVAPTEADPTTTASRADRAAGSRGLGRLGGTSAALGDGWSAALAVGCVVALWSLAFRGFEGGRWSDIPIFKSFIDPSLYVRDPFVYSLHGGTPAAYSYRFVAAVAGGLSFLPLDAVLFVLYLPTSAVSLALLYRIALHLAGDRISALIFLLLYVAGFRLLTVGSTILHSAELTPAFLALPLQLGALYAFLRERHALAGILAGLAVVVHTPTSSYVGLAIGLAYLLRLGHYGIRNVAVAGGLMLLCAAPAVAGAVSQHADALPGWALQLARIELATDLSMAVNWDRAPLRLYNVAGLLLLGVVLVAPSRDGRRRAVVALFAAVIVLCAVAFVFIDVSLRGPISTLVARLQFPRSAWIVNVLGLVYLAHYLRAGWTDGRLPRLVILTLVGAMLVSPSDFVPVEPIWLCSALLIVLAELLARLAPPARHRILRIGLNVAAVVAVVGLAGTSAFLRRTSLFDFGDAARAAMMIGVLVAAWLLMRALHGRVAYNRALGAGVAVGLIGALAVRGSSDWLYQAQHRGGLAAAAHFQEWARTRTPKDSVFLILPSEPNNETFYKVADRALYLVRERANQAVYFREHNIEFQERVLALGVSGVLRYREELDPAYRRLTEDQVRVLAARFGVTHFVPARAGEYSFPVVYQEGGWTVYEVTP